MPRLHQRNTHGNWLLISTLTALSMLADCKKQSAPESRTFASPDAAGAALESAAQINDQNELESIFGKDSKAIISSGNAAEDTATVRAFSNGYEQMHRWRKMVDGSQILLIGAENFAFPIPLNRTGTGQWFFDTAAGRDEILRRRIGRNELAVIEVCGALSEAQAEYLETLHDGGTAHQFAAKFISDTGKQNGLYWDSPGQPKSPLGPLVAFATPEGLSVKPDAHMPLHGYYFRMLNGQGSNVLGGAKDYSVNGTMSGGFAFIAYPAEYGSSGLMTFIVNQDGVLLQKDLGKTTEATATSMKIFDPDSSWTVVQD